MPTYDYLCENGHRFEEIQRFADDALEKCVVCGAPCRRMLHAPAIHFKGSGFYSTDYGTKKRGPNGSESSKSESGGGDSGGGDSGGGGGSGGSESSKGGGETSKTPATPSTDSKPAKSSSSDS
jgi:putative FmdB family regulatory protein